MPATVMTCTKAEKHSNADSLRVYSFVAGENTLQIVANLTNVYEVGDRAIIIQAPSQMKDGTIIRETTLRGVVSKGMAIGKTDLPEGTDLTGEHCEEYNPGNLIPWPHIESMYNIRRSLVNAGMECKVLYKAKIKLDGSNASVSLPPSSYEGLKVIPQSHGRVISVSDDNMGSAKWVVANYSFFLNVRKRCDSMGITDHIVIYGEWSGLGINKTCAISKIPNKIVAVFAIQIGAIDGKLETDPDKIKDILGDLPKDMYILPWFGEEIELDYADKAQLELAAEKINKMVADVEKCDPWVKETFGVEGIGEGVVMYPISNGTLISKSEYSDFVFKAKGEKHKVVNAKKPAQVDPEVANSVNEYVELVCTENRLEQIAQKVGLDMKNIGTFLKEFCSDVQRESEAELEAAGLDWKKVSKPVMDFARKWYVGQCNKV